MSPDAFGGRRAWAVVARPHGKTLLLRYAEDRVTDVPLWLNSSHADLAIGGRRCDDGVDEAAVAGLGIARIQKIGGPGTTTIMRILNSYPDWGRSPPGAARAISETGKGPGRARLARQGGVHVHPPYVLPRAGLAPKSPAPGTGQMWWPAAFPGPLAACAWSPGL